MKDNKDNSRHLARKYARIFVLGHYLFLEANSFLELRSRKTVRFSEQIMSADKYTCIFSSQMAAIVYIFPNFQNCSRCEKNLKDTETQQPPFGAKISSDICPWTLSVPRSSNCSLLGTDNVRGRDYLTLTPALLGLIKSEGFKES